MITDPVLDRLRTADPDHYLVRAVDPSGAKGWRPAAELRAAGAWPEIARAYAADIGCSSVVVGGSCALQGYAGRVAALSIGRWAMAGRGVRLTSAPLWVQLRSGRTVGLALAPSGDQPAHDDGPATPTAIAEDIVAHLDGVVTASQTVSRLRPVVSWGNVAAAVASAWRRVHDAAPETARATLRAAAEECFAAAAWPWLTVPLTWEVVGARHGASLTYRRETCCLMRLAEGKRECASCDRLDAAEVRSRWTDAMATQQTPPRIEVGAHV